MKTSKVSVGIEIYLNYYHEAKNDLRKMTHEKVFFRDLDIVVNERLYTMRCRCVFCDGLRLIPCS